MDRIESLPWRRMRKMGQRSLQDVLEKKKNRYKKRSRVKPTPRATHESAARAEREGTHDLYACDPGIFGDN